MIQIIERTGLEQDSIQQTIDITTSLTTNSTLSDSKRPSCERDLIFVTGNSNKYTELLGYFQTDIFKTLNITQRDIDLPEIQHSSKLKIVEEKCKSAYKLLGPTQGEDKYSVLIEDTCLDFDEWKGLPGPYIKWFMQSIGASGLHRMLHGFANKSATATCTYAIMSDPGKIVFCQGVVHGQIVEPRGGNGFGWDACFQENHTQLTFGEMNETTKQKYSHRSKAVEALQCYLRRQNE